MKQMNFLKQFDLLDVFPSVRKMKANLKLSDEAMIMASNVLIKQNNKLAVYEQVLQEVVKERDLNIKAAHEWKRLAEVLQTKFAMLEYRGSEH
jgi:hypothetical protein